MLPTFPVRVDPESCVPTAIRRHLLGGGDLPEHRLVSIAFIHFDEIDEMIREEGLDVVAERLHRLVVCAQQACEAHEVTFLATDVERDGGRITLDPAAPEATEKGEGRMLLATRQIRDTNHGPPL